MSQAARRIQPLVEPYVDGELSAEQTVEMEQALTESEELVEHVRLTQAVKLSTHRAVSEERPSEEFRARLQARLAVEREREKSRASSPHDRALSWRMILPMAAAAAVTLVWAGQINQKEKAGPSAKLATPKTAGAGGIAAASSGLRADQLIDDLVRHHADGLAPEVTEAALTEQFEPRVGVPVHVPRLQHFGARFMGGSVVPLRNHRAAQFRYRLDGHKVTVYVYDSKAVPVRNQLEAKVIRNVPVYMGQRRGYSIAAVEKRGVGYAVATDLDQPESAELVVASMH